MKRWKQIIAVILTAMIMVTGYGSGSANSDGGTNSAGGTNNEGGTNNADGTSSAGAAYSSEDIDSYPDENEEEVKYSRAIAKRSQSREDSDPTITPLDPPGKAGKESRKKAYTVMIYMVGSDLESKLGCATNDIEEIDSAALDFDSFNVVIFTGGSSRWVGGVPCNYNCVLDMSRTGADRIVAQTKGNANMGDPQTLSSFLNFCGEYYPADHNALILWDHGGGPLWGYGSDELYDSDSLLLDEMKAAMDASPFHGGENGKKLDFIGFDACLMGSLECMTIWKDYADYYIGSEEMEPGDGWDYSFLKVLQGKTETGEKTSQGKTETGEAASQGKTETRGIAEAIIRSFENYYANKRSATYNPDLTLSCVDLSRIDRVNEALDALAVRMKEAVEDGGYPALVKDRAETKSFGISRNSEGDVRFYFDLVDIGDFAEHMQAFYPEEAGELKASLTDAVVNEYSNIEDAAGITLYYPHKNKGMFEQLNEFYEGVLSVKSYADFLEAGKEMWLRSKSRDWNLGTPEDAGDEFTLRLSEEVLSNMTGATYTILIRDSKEGGYVPYMENCKIVPDKDGVIHLSKNPKVAVLRSGEDTTLIRAEETGSDRKRKDYMTKGMQVASDYFNLTSDGDGAIERITVRFCQNNKSGETEIQCVEQESSSAIFSGGKSTIDIMDWKAVYIRSYTDYLVPSRERSGRIRPYAEWIRPGVYKWSKTAVDRSFLLDFVEIRELGITDEIICQIQIEDINGEKYASEPVMLVNPNISVNEVSTESGKMEFAVYPDHAELAHYAGMDEQIIVPETVEGVPVTGIRNEAFSWYELFIPDEYDHVKEIVLPGTVEEIGPGAFAKCQDLEKIHISDGVKKIGYGAFWDCDSLHEIELPGSVETIGNCAFAGCSSLTEFRIPENLRSMGTGVFTECAALRRFTQKKAESIGNGDRKGGKEPVLREDGAIYTADGTELLAYPAAAGETFAVAKGTKKIAYRAFTGDSLEEVVLPEELEEISSYAFFECSRLKAPVFHEGITKVGRNAFDISEFEIKKEEWIPAQQEVIYIPASLESIGENAFDAFPNVRFEVSGDNHHYSDAEGALMNKAGDVVIRIATDPSKTVVFSEGTIEFEESLFDAYDTLEWSLVKNIYLPSSMEKFPMEIEENTNKGEYAFYHCPAGSEAEKFAIRAGLELTNEMGRKEKTAEISTEKGTLYFDIYRDHAVLYGYSGEDEVVVVPNKAAGKPVTEIGNGSKSICSRTGFSDKEYVSPALRKIVIPEGVTSVNANALSLINAGSEVVLPPTLKRLGHNAMSSFVKIGELPEGLEVLQEDCLGNFENRPFVVTPSIRYIDSQAFGIHDVSAFEQRGDNDYYSVKDGVLFNADGTVLVKYPGNREEKEYVIPEGTLKIEPEAFASCDYLEKISLPGSLKVIGELAFWSCRALEEIEYSEDTMIVTIGESAFNSCGSLKEIELPPVKVIKRDAFGYCSSLHTVHLSEGTIEIEDYVFSNTAVSAPVFPKSLKKIGDYVFGTDSFADGVLSGSAEVIRIPAGLTEIGHRAFGQIGNTRFEVDPENTEFSEEDGLLLDADGNYLILCPPGRNGIVEVPEGVTAIRGDAFDRAYGVTDIVIPESVIYIEDLGIAEYGIRENGELTQLAPVTIHCKEGSFAEQYAIRKGIPYEAE